jgi:sugar lactone lactonase YvrE
LLLASLVWLAPLKAGASTFTPPTFLRTIGGPGHAFIYPWGMATANDGTILMSDYNNYNIRRFNTSGTSLQTFGGTHNPGCPNQQPYSVTVDRNDGSIYLSDTINGQYIKYDSTGKCLFAVKVTAPDLYLPQYNVNLVYIPWISVNSKGTVYVASAHNITGPGLPVWPNRVLEYDSNGNQLKEWGTDGTGPGQFNLIRGADFDANDNYYVNDVGCGCVQVFDSNDNFMYQFGTPGNGPGLLSLDTRGLKVDRVNGFVYVVDAKEGTVHKFTLSGTWVQDIGSQGGNPGQFGGVRDVTIGPDGNLYISDYAFWHITVYSPTGTFVGQIPNPSLGPPAGGFNQPDGLAVDTVNNWVYVTDTFNHRVQKFTTTGTWLNMWGARFDNLQAGDSMDYPRGVAVDQSNGNVWVDDTRAADIKGYDSSGNFIRSWGTQGSNNSNYFYAQGIWVGANGQIYVPDSINLRLKVTDQTGKVIKLVPCGSIPSGVSSLNVGCTAVTQDSAGNTYAADTSDNVVIKWDSNWNATTIGTPGAGAGQLNAPTGVAVFGNRLYVEESGNNRISAFDLTGNFLGIFGSYGRGNGQMVNPRGMGVDASGNIYVVDTVNQRIEVFAP